MAKKTAKQSKPLIQQHRRFVSAYRRLRNATRAYAAVYPRASANTADSEGARLLNTPRIAQEIEAQDLVALQREQMGADEVLMRIARIARAEFPEAYDADGNLLQVQEMPDHVKTALRGFIIQDGRRFPLFWDKDKALNTLAKHHKLLVERQELTGADGGPIAIRWAGEPDAAA